MSNGVNVDAPNGPLNRRSGPMMRPRCKTIARRQQSRQARSRSDDSTATGDDTPERLLLLRNVGETVPREEQPQPASDGVLPTEMASGPSETVASEGARVIDRRIRRGVNADAGEGGGGVASGRRTQLPVLTNRHPAAAAESGNPVAPTAPGDGSSELAPDSETAEFDSNEE